MPVSFRLALLLAFALTVMSFAGSIALALLGPPTKPVEGLIETFSTTWKIGCGAFFGLLGGKLLP
jgi:hypothetical protein